MPAAHPPARAHLMDYAIGVDLGVTRIVAAGVADDLDERMLAIHDRVLTGPDELGREDLIDRIRDDPTAARELALVVEELAARIVRQAGGPPEIVVLTAADRYSRSTIEQVEAALRLPGEPETLSLVGHEAARPIVEDWVESGTDTPLIAVDLGHGSATLVPWVVGSDGRLEPANDPVVILDAGIGLVDEAVSDAVLRDELGGLTVDELSPEEANELTRRCRRARQGLDGLPADESARLGDEDGTGELDAVELATSDFSEPRRARLTRLSSAIRLLERRDPDLASAPLVLHGGGIAEPFDGLPFDLAERLSDATSARQMLAIGAATVGTDLDRYYRPESGSPLSAIDARSDLDADGGADSVRRDRRRRNGTILAILGVLAVIAFAVVATRDTDDSSSPEVASRTTLNDAVLSPQPPDALPARGDGACDRNRSSYICVVEVVVADKHVWARYDANELVTASVDGRPLGDYTAHFYFDELDEADAGGDSSPYWRAWGVNLTSQIEPPEFSSEGPVFGGRHPLYPGFTTAEVPPGADALCAVLADPDGEPILGTGGCAPLP